jgi:transposase-like protein
MEYFKDEEAARKYLETIRWGDNPKCPYCNTNKIPSRLKTAGKYRCRSCRKSFDVTSKTLMQGTRAGLHLWLHAFSMITASKKQLSVYTLHRKLRLTYRTAWFLNHAVNEAMERAELSRQKDS